MKKMERDTCLKAKGEEDKSESSRKKKLTVENCGSGPAVGQSASSTAGEEKTLFCMKWTWIHSPWILVQSIGWFHFFIFFIF